MFGGRLNFSTHDERAEKLPEDSVSSPPPHAVKFQRHEWVEITPCSC